MHEHRVVVLQHAVGRGSRLGRPRRRLEHVADRAHEPTPRGPSLLDERLELETQQPPAERVRLGEEHVRRMLRERGEQHVPAGGAPGIVDLATAHVHQGAVARVRDPGGRQRDDSEPSAKPDLRKLRAAGDVHDIGPTLAQCTRDRGGPALVTNPHQMLDPDHDPGRSREGGHRTELSGGSHRTGFFGTTARAVFRLAAESITRRCPSRSGRTFGWWNVKTPGAYAPTATRRRWPPPSGAEPGAPPSARSPGRSPKAIHRVRAGCSALPARKLRSPDRIGSGVRRPSRGAPGTCR